MRRILLSAFVVMASSAAIAAGATGAFFSDTETSLGNLFTAGEIDLKVDNDSYYNGNRCVNVGDEQNPNWQWQGNAAFPVPGSACDTSWPLADLNNGEETLHKFFNFADVKPSDDGEDTISLHVQNDAWMCMNVSLTSNDDNTTTEPEGLVDAAAEDAESNVWDGELAQTLQMFWWADDGDNVYEEGEKILSGEHSILDGVETLYDLATTSPFVVALADSQNNAWGETPGTPVPAGTSYIAKAWCFGTLTIAPEDPGPADNPVNSGPQTRGGGYTCDGDNLGNETQTDSATLNVSFSAVQARHNPTFQCEIPEETRACVDVERFASAFHDVDQGTRKNGTAILADRTDPNDVLGAPQSLGTPYDNPVIAGSFFSLGFKSHPSGTATTTPGGSIVVSFPGNVVQGPGPDLKLWEVTGGTSYPDELVMVEVSNSLAGPWTLVTASATRDAEMELPIASAKYVRITDVSPPGPFETTADGFDLDAIQALNCEIPVQ